MDGINVVELTIVVVLFLVVTVLGFVASRWRRAETSCTWTSGGWAAGASARGSPGSCSAVTSTRRTRSSRCRR